MYIAQLVERRIVVPYVVGSNPTIHPKFMFYALLAQLVEQLICNQQVIGSTPIQGSKIMAG